MFLFIGDSKRRKYFTMNKFHTKISNGEFFPNYGITVFIIITLIMVANILLGYVYRDILPAVKKNREKEKSLPVYDPSMFIK